MFSTDYDFGADLIQKNNRNVRVICHIQCEYLSEYDANAIY